MTSSAEDRGWQCRELLGSRIFCEVAFPAVSPESPHPCLDRPCSTLRTVRYLWYSMWHPRAGQRVVDDADSCQMYFVFSVHRYSALVWR
jgi:hypothetical protein